MVGVVIVGVLATLAVRAVSVSHASARSADGRVAVRAVSAAQEAFFAERGVYANISSSNTTGWYPRDIGPGVAGWQPGKGSDYDPNTTTGRNGWSELDVPLETSAAVCTTGAGGPGVDPNGRGPLADHFAFSYVPAVDWFVVNCATDTDGDGEPAYFGGSSLFGMVLSNTQIDEAKAGAM